MDSLEQEGTSPKQNLTSTLASQTPYNINELEKLAHHLIERIDIKTNSELEEKKKELDSISRESWSLLNLLHLKIQELQPCE